MEEWQALSVCQLCGQTSNSQDNWSRVFPHPAQLAIRLRAYQALTSQSADLSTHKQDALRFLSKLSQEPYGSRVTLGIWIECQISTFKPENFQVERETAKDSLGLFHGPMELMMQSLWDSRAAILSGKAAGGNQGACWKGARCYDCNTGSPTIHVDIFAVRLSCRPFRTFRFRTDAGCYV